MNSRACIISLHFHPANVSWLIAYGKIFEELGYEVDYIIHPAYKSFAEFAHTDSACISTTPGWDTSKQYEHALFTNAAVKNHMYGKILKKTGCKVWYIYHEPWESLRTYLRTENMSVIMKFYAAHYLSAKMLAISDGVILPSQCCVSDYERCDIRYNPTYFRIPLLYDDEAGELLNEKRLYFSYIGTITKAHGFDKFIEFVKFSLRRNLDIRFLIASQVPLPEDVTRDEAIAKASDRIVVHCGRPLSNNEINLCFAQSICVWNVYRRSTQSGVLAKATMFGSPVLASDTGSFREFVDDRQDGRFLQDVSPESVLEAYEDIRSNINRYTSLSREKFLTTFYYKSQLELCRNVFLGTPHVET